MNIAENLRRLRRDADLTQEDLARHLGCSPQAISKWERGDGYPEITLLPAIADFFKVTLDELCGMDEVRKNARIEEINREFARRLGDATQGSQGAIAYLKETLPEFPSAYFLWLTLAQLMGSLIIIGENPREEQMREAVEIFNRIIERCPDERTRESAISSIAITYQKLGEQENAEEQIKKLPVSRQLEMQAIIFRGEKQIQAIQSKFAQTAYEFWRYTRFALTDTYVLDTDGDTFGYSIEERIRILEKGAQILELLTDGAPHAYPMRIAVNYRGMALLAASDGQHDRALDYLDKCADFAVEAETAFKKGVSVKLEAPLLNRYEYFPEGGAAGDAYTTLTRTDDLQRHEFDAIRDHPRFLAVAERLRAAVESA